jgi:hypothetical protein
VALARRIFVFNPAGIRELVERTGATDIGVAWDFVALGRWQDAVSRDC